MVNACLLGLLVLAACAPRAAEVPAGGDVAPLQSQQLYVIPFETVMVPAAVADGLFDRFIDQLNQQGAARGYAFVILKQPLDQVDADWLRQRDYLRGEVFAYLEDVGSSMTEIKARGRLRLYQPGREQPAWESTYAAERFYENAYSALTDERRKLAEELSTTLAERLLQVLPGRAGAALQAP